jgi:hypothetical protein
MTKLYNNRNFKKIKMAGILVIPAILLFLPFNFFDNRGPVCIVTLLTGYECYGCGMTRACQRIIHFKFEEAYHFNKLALIVFPILVYGWIKEGIETYRSLKNTTK